MQNFSKKYAAFVVRYRLFILIPILLATLVAGFFVKDIKILNDPDTFLPQNNRYVLTNSYGEAKFGFGNLMIVGVMLKKCVGGDQPYQQSDKVVSYDVRGVLIDRSAAAKMTQEICQSFGGSWQDDKDVYQPWFVNLIIDLRWKLVKLPFARPYNFIDIGAQKVKYMGLSEYGGLEFNRMAPIMGISKDLERSKLELAHLKKGLETNPVLSPMLLLKQDKYGNRCPYGEQGCSAQGMFIITDYTDKVKEDYLPWINSLQDIIDQTKAEYGDRVEIRLAGEPHFLSSMLRDLVKHWWLFVITLLIVILTLRLFNHHWNGAFLAFLSVLASITLTLGLMGFVQYKLTTMMILTPLLVLAIGTGHAVQVYRRYLSILYSHKQYTPLEAAEKSIAKTITPATIAIITDMIGFFTLAFVDLSFYKAYAYFGMFGMATLLITTTTLLPIVAAMFDVKLLKNTNHDKDGQSKFEQFTASSLMGLINTKLKFIPITGIVILIAISTHYTKILESTSEVIMPGVETGIHYSQAAFKYDTPVNVDFRRLNEVMPGVISVNIPIKGIKPLLIPCSNIASQIEGVECWDEENDKEQGIFNNAKALLAIEKFEDWMRSHPNIGFTGSYVQYLKMTNMLMMTEEGEEPDMALFRIPSEKFIKNTAVYRYDPEDPIDADNIVSSFNGILRTSMSAGDLDTFVSRNWNEGMIIGFVNTMDPDKTAETTRDIQDYLKSHENKPGFNQIKWGYRGGDIFNMPNGVRKTANPELDDKVGVGGFLGAIQATHDIARAEFLRPAITSILAIIIVLLLVFRSTAIAALLSSLLLVGLFTQYGLGGYFASIENWSGNLHFATLSSLSIALGLSVDYGVYVVFRLREELKTKNFEQALQRTLSSSGYSVIVSIAVLIVSFIPLLMTNLANTWAMAIYISVALIVNMLLALTLLPILIKFFKPKAIFGDSSNKKLNNKDTSTKSDS